MNHSKDNWADPWAFKPERFLSDSEEAAKAGNQLDALQPFNVGPRNCIGRKYGVSLLIFYFYFLQPSSSYLVLCPTYPITWLPPSPQTCIQFRTEYVSSLTRYITHRSLAYAEMRLIMARIVYDFDMKLADDSKDWIKRQRAFSLWDRIPLNVYLTPVERTPVATVG